MNQRPSPRRSPVPTQLADGRLPSAVSDGQLIVVSNRQPYRHDRTDDGVTVDRPTGGLTAGLDPVLQRVGGTWVAWGDGEADRATVDADGTVAVPPDDPAYSLKRVWLSEEQVTGYYLGYSNRVLWPLCHATLSNVCCDPSYWEHYRDANEQFADAVIAAAGDRPVIWFQDYHLALAPRQVRRRLPTDAVLAQFWHIPWPAWDTFRACPHGSALLQGLLANDLLAFHAERYGTNFLDCVETALEEATVDWQGRRVSYRGQVTDVEDVPMGVPTDEVRRLAASPTATSFRSSFADEYGIDEETRLLVGVDRLDYTKGIPFRLRALAELWERHPEWRAEFTYVQKASESRTRIPAYRQLQEEVESLVDRINDRFGTESWQPIVYTTDRLDQAELYGIYRQADAALVTPIRDGMNLVAQEYVAAQVDGDGVLVLSDQTGSHDLLGEYALTTNPFDIGAVARTIAEALSIPGDERRRRMAHLREQVSANDLRRWADRNLTAAVSVACERGRPTANARLPKSGEPPR